MSQTSNEDRLILDRRIHNQRARLRWWENLFNQHVHAHWRKARPEYFQIVRRDIRAVAINARNAALEEAAQVAERLGSHLVRGETCPEYVGGNLDVAAAIRALSESAPNPLQEQIANIGKEGGSVDNPIGKRG